MILDNESFWVNFVKIQKNSNFFRETYPEIVDGYQVTFSKTQL